MSADESLFAEEGIVLRENGLWDVLYEARSAGITANDLAEVWEEVRIDALDKGEGWAE